VTCSQTDVGVYVPIYIIQNGDILVQNGDILVPANPDPSGKMAIKMAESKLFCCGLLQIIRS